MFWSWFTLALFRPSFVLVFPGRLGCVSYREAQAMTAHAAQGQTLPAAIVDLQIGQGTSPIASYVALTCVKTRDDLLIYRPFEHSLFTKDSLEGPTTLLKLLRGDAVNWKALEEKYTPQRKCAGCNFARFKTEYTTFQFKRQDGYHQCNDCIEKKQGDRYAV